MNSYKSTYITPIKQIADNEESILSNDQTPNRRILQKGNGSSLAASESQASLSFKPVAKQEKKIVKVILDSDDDEEDNDSSEYRDNLNKLQAAGKKQGGP
jgi:hypothetical protein